jgi:hypothetical protein
VQLPTCAVEAGQEHRGNLTGQKARRAQPLQRACTAVDQHHLVARLDDVPGGSSADPAAEQRKTDAVERQAAKSNNNAAKTP